MTPVKTSQTQRGRAMEASTASWDLGRALKVAIAGFAVIWLISQFTESPLDQALQAVGVEQGDGTSIKDYNEQQWRDEIFDPIIGCPPGVDCHGLPDPSGY